MANAKFLSKQSVSKPLLIKVFLFLLILAGFYLIGMTNINPARATTDGLTAHWSFDETTGKTALDSAGSNNGTLNGSAIFTAGKFGNALSLNGTSTSFVNTGTGNFMINQTNEFTISAWFYVDSSTVTPPYTQNIITRGQYIYPFSIQLTDKNIKTGLRTSVSNSVNYLNSNTSIEFNRWNHVAMTYKSGSRIIYINGVKDVENTPTGTISNLSDLEVTKIGELFKGKLDDIKIYNRALSAQEISNLYNPLLVCTPNWSCLDWSSCSSSNTQIRTCTDTNACGVTTGKPAESQNCTYTPPSGNTFYVNANSTCTSNCTGATWTNAPKTLPATLTRGATYYIAAGNYGSYTFDDPENGTQAITIKKATAADHGSPNGWQTSYGTGQAVFSSSAGDTLTFLTGYYVFDGQAGGGPGNWMSGHGFKLTNADPDVSHVVHVIRIGRSTSYLIQQPTNFIFKHIEMVGRNPIGPADDFIYVWGYDDTSKLTEACSGGCGTRNLTLSYSYLHNIGRGFILTMYGQNYTFEYNYFTDQSSSPTSHGAAIESFGDDNVTIRYNVFANVSGTGFLDLKKNYNDVNENWYVYGNVFDYTPGTTATGIGNGVFNSTSLKPFTQYPRSGECNNMNFYNNDVINLGNGTLNAGIYFTAGNNNKAYNNIWYGNMAHQIGFTNVVHDYNAFYDNNCSAISCSSAAFFAGESNSKNGIGNPFMDWQNNDFSLKTATNAGLSFSSPYNIDLNGKIRGADGIWDIGAYEYLENTPAANPAPNPTPTPSPTPTPVNTCTPNWSCSDWNSCSSSGTQTRICTDTNACGVTTDKPVESQSCTYVPPANICTPSWSCSDWNSCSSSDTQTRICTDTNACGVTTDKPAESQSCTYVAPTDGKGHGWHKGQHS